VRDRAGTASVPVRYTGTVPDPFREGREVIVTGKMRDGLFVAEQDSLVTKCPSKFTKKNSQ
jgi:cytochrome c-type biogenesis protein CcmE